MKRFIDIHVPVTTCNLQCHYCYVSQENVRNTKPTEFMYSPQHIGRALSRERLGGICHFNMCGLGETLIPPQIIDITREILSNGHYIMIVTNGLLTERFDKFIELPDEYRKRLGFKFSFHYLEFKKRNLLNVFLGNVKKVKESGISFSIELTPNDELEPYIDDIKKICNDNFGAYCHVTIPRDMNKEDIELLSKHNIDDFVKIWGTFNSELFNFKYSTWEVKRKEYCYAGAWSGLLNIGNGEFTACYGSRISQNIFKDISKPIEFIAVGHGCKMPHCYNSHSFLALGNIPGIRTCLYSEERNRLNKNDDTEWLNKEMKEFLSHRLEDYNDEFNFSDKVNNEMKICRVYCRKAFRKVVRMVHN